jgi:hypothetical protein
MLLSGTILSYCPIASSVGEEREVGVEVSDWGLYGNINVTWNSNDPNVEPDASLILTNNTVWFDHTVTDVTEWAIFFRNVTHFKNDTETTNNVWVDIEVGAGNGTLMFISAGLYEGALLYTQVIEPVFINKTLTRTYAGAERLVNHLSLISSYSVDSVEPQNILISLDYYWDQVTGILTERQGSFINQTGNYLTSWHKSDMLIETNLWSPEVTPPPTFDGGGLPIWILGVVVAVILGAFVIAYKRHGAKQRGKRRRPSRRR